MLPQSRNTTVRSAMSAGGAWIRPSSENRRYSRGSGRSSGEMNIAESLPSALEQALHRHQRAERVAVGVLVRGEHEARVLAQALEHQLACVGRRLASARRRSRAPIASLDQLLHAQRAVGRLVVDELERRRALQAQLAGEARLQVAVGAAQALERRLALGLGGAPPSPSTLTYTRAWRRSGLVLTSVTVTNPTRGSFRSPATASPITWRIASSTRRIRPVLILPVQFPADAAVPAGRLRPAARQPCSGRPLRRTARAPPGASRRSPARRPRAGPGSWRARSRTRSRWRPRARRR